MSEWQSAEGTCGAVKIPYCTPCTVDDYTSVTLSELGVYEGFCFDCERPVGVEYHRVHIGSCCPPPRCLKCGGTDVAFFDRLSEYLWAGLEECRALLNASHLLPSKEGSLERQDSD